MAKTQVQAAQPETPVRQWPAEHVEKRALSALLPYARNARTHSAAQIGQIASSILEWGWTMPVLADENGIIIAGHGRVLAAERLAIEEIPVMIAHGWSDAQKQAYRIADNKLAENAGWDEALLGVEIADLKAYDYDVSLLGYSDKEIAKLCAEPEDHDASPQLGGLTYSIIISCESEINQKELLEQFEQQGLKCKVLIS
jgi:ParB-like chromosome segregation protein Spo0J